MSDHPVWSEVKAEIIACDKAYQEAVAQRDKFVDGVKKVIYHYDTINEALAAWPALRFVLPDDMQDQDFPFDGTPKPLPDDINVAELTALITRAKLMEA